MPRYIRDHPTKTGIATPTTTANDPDAVLWIRDARRRRRPPYSAMDAAV